MIVLNFNLCRFVGFEILLVTFRIYSRFNGLNPLLDEVPSFLGTSQTKEILNVRAKGLRQTEGLLECGILL